MAATAKEVRADGLVGPAVDAVEAGPDTCGELAAPGAGGTGLAWGIVVVGLIVGDGRDDEPPEIGVIGELAAAWGTAPAACVVEYAGAPPDAADATDETGVPEPADVTAAARAGTVPAGHAGYCTRSRARSTDRDGRPR